MLQTRADSLQMSNMVRVSCGDKMAAFDELIIQVCRRSLSLARYVKSASSLHPDQHLNCEAPELQYLCTETRGWSGDCY